MVVERVFKYLKHKGINKSEFYRRTGMSNGYLDKVKDVGVSKIGHILNVFPDLSPIWLVKGEGPMLKSQIERPPEIDINTYLVDVQKKLIEKLEEDNERLKKQIKRGNGQQYVAEPGS
jgi:tRNA A-37 threonylcarbamoyl transferase component Bud32